MAKTLKPMRFGAVFVLLPKRETKNGPAASRSSSRPIGYRDLEDFEDLERERERDIYGLETVYVPFTLLPKRPRLLRGYELLSRIITPLQSSLRHLLSSPRSGSLANLETPIWRLSSSQLCVVMRLASKENKPTGVQKPRRHQLRNSPSWPT